MKSVESVKPHYHPTPGIERNSTHYRKKGAHAWELHIEIVAKSLPSLLSLLGKHRHAGNVPPRGSAVCHCRSSEIIASMSALASSQPALSNVVVRCYLSNTMCL